MFLLLLFYHIQFKKLALGLSYLSSLFTNYQKITKETLHIHL